MVDPTPLFPESEGEKATVWVCGCGCQTFRLFGDGQVWCAECDVMQINISHFDPTDNIPSG